MTITGSVRTGYSWFGSSCRSILRLVHAAAFALPSANSRLQSGFSLSVECMLSGRERPSRKMSPTHACCAVQVLQCENPHYWNSRKTDSGLGALTGRGRHSPPPRTLSCALHSPSRAGGSGMSRASGFGTSFPPNGWSGPICDGSTAERACRHQRLTPTGAPENASERESPDCSEEFEKLGLGRCCQCWEN